VVGFGRRFQAVQPHVAEEAVASICRGTFGVVWRDNKARFEFQCIAGHQMATRKGLINEASQGEIIQNVGTSIFPWEKRHGSIKHGKSSN